MSRIYLEITDRAVLDAFVKEARKAGFLKEIRIDISEDKFPIRVPVDIDGVLKVAANPLVKKMFGKKVETSVTMYLERVLEAG